MLELRPGCETCDRDLPPDSPDARICTYECTFCADCAERLLKNVCPNCGGNLVARPIRPAAQREKHPASTARVYKPLTGERAEKHAALLARYAGVPPERR